MAHAHPWSLHLCNGAVDALAKSVYWAPASSVLKVFASGVDCAGAQTFVDLFRDAPAVRDTRWQAHLSAHKALWQTSNDFTGLLGKFLLMYASEAPADVPTRLPRLTIVVPPYTTPSILVTFGTHGPPCLTMLEIAPEWRPIDGTDLDCGAVFQRCFPWTAYSTAILTRATPLLTTHAPVPSRDPQTHDFVTRFVGLTGWALDTLVFRIVPLPDRFSSYRAESRKRPRHAIDNPDWTAEQQDIVQQLLRGEMGPELAAILDT